MIFDRVERAERVEDVASHNSLKLYTIYTAENLHPQHFYTAK